MSSRRRTQKQQLLPLLARVIASAAAAGEPGHAEALEAYARLALIEVPRRGVLAPADQQVEKAIEAIAREHLGLNEPRAELRKALASVEPFERREAIESAHNFHESVSDVSYFYVGLAYGITLAALAGDR